jgi:hypothetical protein
MKVGIFSLMAACMSATDNLLPVWAGDVPDTLISGSAEATDSEYQAETNEALFRLFNRVEPEDSERLEAWGYRLPSLSVGDVIAWGGNSYRIDSVGFTKLTNTDAGAAAVMRAYSGAS